MLTVALRVLERRFPGLRRWGGTWSDLGVCLPLFSAGDQGLLIARGPSAAHGCRLVKGSSHLSVAAPAASAAARVAAAPVVPAPVRRVVAPTCLTVVGASRPALTAMA
jgi:hypothetical protein